MARGGYDLALTEILESGRHEFLVETGSERGEEVVADCLSGRRLMTIVRPPSAWSIARSHQMGRAMDTAGIKELLYRNMEHPRWDDVAARCLSCANCTMVCPTCFCSTSKR